MDIKVYNSLEQIDLGVVQPELPPLRFLKEFAAAAPGPPPQIIEGIMHQGCKLALGGHEQER